MKTSSTEDVEKQLLKNQLAELREQLKHDTLTGLYNRYFLEQWIKKYEADGTPIVIAYIDIDCLKPVNDRHGHATGDEVLCHTSDLLKQCCRKSDYAIRLSGDEFLLLLPGIPPGKTISVSKRLQAKLEPLSTVGFSFGIASGLAGDIQNIIILADQNMYKQKQQKAVFSQRAATYSINTPMFRAATIY